MPAETITLQIPEILYQRLVNTAPCYPAPTSLRLRMNNPVIIVAGRRWVISGWHPPTD